MLHSTELCHETVRSALQFLRIARVSGPRTEDHYGQDHDPMSADRARNRDRHGDGGRAVSAYAGVLFPRLLSALPALSRVVRRPCLGRRKTQSRIQRVRVTPMALMTTAQ